MISTDTILKTATGGLGISVLEVVSEIETPDYMAVSKLLLQILVAIGTLISLFKKKKDKV